MDYGYYNMDCMDGMREFPDNFFDIAIVDPPYFSGPERRGFFGRKVSPIGVVSASTESLQAWEVPGEEYFPELERVSKHQLYLAVIILTGTSRRGGLSGINAMIPVAFPTAKSLPAACMIRSKFFGICGAG